MEHIREMQTNIVTVKAKNKRRKRMEEDVISVKFIRI